jgi:hypothetical protein
MGDAAAVVEKPKEPVKDPRDVYFVNPWVDVLVAGGGLSILFFFVVVGAGWGPFAAKEYDRPEWAWQTAALLAYVVNFPHFAATNFRLYQSFDRMMQFPKTSFLSPVLVIGGLAYALVDTTFAEWYAKLFLTWSSYHFCAQTKGIALLYARRLGIHVDSLSRWLIIIATHTPFTFGTLRPEAQPNLGPFYSITVPRGIPWFSFTGGLHFSPVGFPTEWAAGVETAAWASFWLGCAALVILLVRTVVVQSRWLPLAVLVPILAQMLWFGPLGSRSRAFNEFVPFFHSLQYMIIAWLFQLKEESARSGFLPGIENVFWDSIKWFALVVAGGVLLFLIWPYALAWHGYSLQHSLGCVNAAIQIHHFFVDGVIWKIRDPRTRAMLGGNLFDLAGFGRIRTISPV